MWRLIDFSFIGILITLFLIGIVFAAFAWMLETNPLVLILSISGVITYLVMKYNGS